MWNRFVDFVVHVEPSKMNNAQLCGYYAFWYEAEMESGGHIEYFTNNDFLDHQQAIQKISILSNGAFSKIMQRAWALYKHYQLSGSKEEVDRLANELTVLDKRFKEIHPPLIKVLENFVSINSEEFTECPVSVTPASP